tara:strand:- start:369 stop:854 length:486 start_codon:yes stop_codon:yes gene_type:complete
MKKKYYLISSFLLLILINGCAGYEPIFSSTNLQFKIANYTIEGNKTLGNIIYSKLYNVSKSRKDNQNIKNIDLYIKVTQEKQPTSKNSAGKILEYKITLKTEVKIVDFLTDKKLLDQTLTSSTSYNTQDQYSETISLENKAIENLVDGTYQELLIKLSQII